MGDVDCKNIGVVIWLELVHSRKYSDNYQALEYIHAVTRLKRGVIFKIYVVNINDMKLSWYFMMYNLLFLKLSIIKSIYI